MKCYTWMVLVLICAVAEARTPESMREIPDMGWVNTKPDADNVCWLHIYGAKIPIASASEVGVQSQWDFSVQLVEQPMPINPMESMHSNTGNVIEEEVPGMRPGEMITIWTYQHPTDEDGNLLLPSIPTENDWCDYINECKVVEGTWQWDLLQQYERIYGNAKFPAGMHLNVMQLGDQNSTSNCYIVDRETNTVWRQKPQPQW